MRSHFRRDALVSSELCWSRAQESPSDRLLAQLHTTPIRRAPCKRGMSRQGPLSPLVTELASNLLVAASVLANGHARLHTRMRSALRPTSGAPLPAQPRPAQALLPVHRKRGHGAAAHGCAFERLGAARNNQALPAGQLRDHPGRCWAWIITRRGDRYATHRHRYQGTGPQGVRKGCLGCWPTQIPSISRRSVFPGR